MSKIKVGVIGCGGIARRRHFPALLAQPDVEVVAACDVDENCVQSVASEFGVPRVFSDYKDMLSMDEMDAVDICTPNFVHMAPTIAALEAGKHVLVEKPIARNAAEAARMVEAARKSGTKLMVAHCFRFRSDSQALKRFVDGGAMGEIYYARVHAIRRRGIPSWGVFTDKEKQGGGPLIDIGVHILDTALWLMGYPRPVSASAMTYAKFGKRPGVIGLWGQWDYNNFTVEDFAAGFVRFENGASLTIESSFAANIEKDSMNFCILGTEGGCQFDPLKIFREEHGTLVDLTPTCLPTVDMYQAEVRAFLDSIWNDTEPAVTGEQALTVAKVLDAIYESSERGAEVGIE
ncbi:MAG: Gfo/Idh/MocA family oxidoreductase [Armatimonadetes bacterium]|nr:Gfo/Idh/MocA family oxidoreductase [Armatimonadota bacterium]